MSKFKKNLQLKLSIYGYKMMNELLATGFGCNRYLKKKKKKLLNLMKSYLRVGLLLAVLVSFVQNHGYKISSLSI